MAEEVSEAAQDYGRSFCLPPEREWLPLNQLTADEAACALRVGRAFQDRLDAALGAQAPTGPSTFGVDTGSGKRVALLTMDGQGDVQLCIPGRSCAVVGHGVDGAIAAEATLGLLGLVVGDTPTAP